MLNACKKFSYSLFDTSTTVKYYVLSLNIAYLLHVVQPQYNVYILVRERSALATIKFSRRVYLSGCLSGCLSVPVFKMFLLREFLSD